MTAEPSVVEFLAVTRRFGALTAVDGISFGVRRGEFFSLLGPSGCGKTTTLRLLAGFETPDAGEVRILGRRANADRPYERPVAMVFQSYALFPHLSVERNVAFGLEERRRPRAEIRQRVGRAMELVRLDAATFARRTPAELSGGQRQRVALARALVLDPAILLLDEPLGALDLQLRREMQLELKALNRELGTTFVYVTHDQEEALTMSDRIAVMTGARIAQLGTPAEIYEAPRTAFVAQFIGTTNLLQSAAGGTGTPRALRPERVQLCPPDAAPDGLDARPGHVTDVIYLGDTLHVIVALADGTRLTAAVPNQGLLGGAPPWRIGDPLVAAWRPDDARVLES